MSAPVTRIDAARPVNVMVFVARTVPLNVIVTVVVTGLFSFAVP